MSTQPPGAYPPFDRRFFASDQAFSVIGAGEIGGKALGLAAAKRLLEDAWVPGAFPGIQVDIPRLAVVGTDVFEQFLALNGLDAVIRAAPPDERLARAFVEAELPPTVVGDLRALIADARTPLAIRSSSLLEDALRHPFAGVYATKLIPNNQPAIQERFRRLTEAIKYVWASTYFHDARSYLRAIDEPTAGERMAVIVQEVIGERCHERFYPTLSGVVRTRNYYPTGPARPEDGVVDLALGLGKTIVDGGLTWTYSPRFPRHRPPFASPRALLSASQTRFWAVRMEPAPYDPVNEAECLVEAGLEEAELDDTLRFTASTYDAAGDRLLPGTGIAGPRVLTFERLLEFDDVPINDVAWRLASHCKDALHADVEVEFAATLDRVSGLPARFGFLQVRPMMGSDETVTVDAADLHAPGVVVSSPAVLGNGELHGIQDVVYVKPAAFDARHTRTMAHELDALNAALTDAGRRYVLIGFGRWGSSDPWLGIPAVWAQLSAARVIVEAALPQMTADASQGAHFFHNMISFRVIYMTVRPATDAVIDWAWLDAQNAESETPFLRHVRLEAPLEIRADGRSGRGVVRRA